MPADGSGRGGVRWGRMSGLRFWGVPTIRGGARTDVRPGVRAPEDHAESVERIVREGNRRARNRLARALAVHRGGALARDHETDHGPDGRARRAGRRRGRARGRRAARRRTRAIRRDGSAWLRARRSERLAGFFRATHAPHLRGGHRAAKVGTPSRRLRHGKPQDSLSSCTQPPQNTGTGRRHRERR